MMGIGVDSIGGPALMGFEVMQGGIVVYGPGHP